MWNSSDFYATNDMQKCIKLEGYDSHIPGHENLFVPIGKMYRNKSQNCMIFQVECIPVSVFGQGSCFKQCRLCVLFLNLTLRF